MRHRRAAPFRTWPGPDLDHRNHVADERKRLLAEDRTWTSRQLAQPMADRSIAMGTRQVRRHLKR